MDTEEKLEGQKIALEQWAAAYTDEILNALYVHQNTPFTANEAVDFVLDYECNLNEEFGGKSASNKCKANLLIWIVSKIFPASTIQEMVNGVEKRYAAIALQDNIGKTHAQDKERAVEVIKSMTASEQIEMLQNALTPELRHKLMAQLTAAPE
jgi:hypothetical protein